MDIFNNSDNDGKEEKIEISPNPPISTKTFILIFMSIIWKEIVKKANIYSEHNMIPMSKYLILKSLKYNIFSNSGIFNSLKPYIAKALKDGFLMPQVYRENHHATNAVKMFKPAYEIIKEGDGTRMKEIEFIMTGCSEDGENNSQTENNNNNNNNHNNHNDEQTDNNGDLYEQASRYGPTECGCHFCETVDTWDINIGLLGGDVFQGLVSKGLVVVLDNYVC